MRDDNYPSPVSDPEAEGLPDTADDDSTAFDDVATGREADGPDPASLPADQPLAVDRFGTTPEEARRGESLDYKLAQYEPDVQPTGSLAPSSTEAEVDTVDAATDRPSQALLTEAPILPTDSPVSMYDTGELDNDEGRPVGRIVEPDEGAHTDVDADAVAYDAGAAGGGASAEELAMHEVREG
jgi:hypothetical protein